MLPRYPQGRTRAFAIEAVAHNTRELNCGRSFFPNFRSVVPLWFLEKVKGRVFYPARLTRF